MSWIPLHLYSQYSVLEATASVEALVEKAEEYALPSLALTDRGNMYGAVEFSKACKGAKIHPIIGCALHLAPNSRLEKKKIPGTPAGFPLVLLAKNGEGYRNLCILASKAHLEGFYWTPRIDKELLVAHSEGLICLSGAHEGSLAHLILQGKDEELKEESAWFHALFGEDYYLEITRQAMLEGAIEADGMTQEGWLVQQHNQFVAAQERVNERLIALSKEQGIPLVATNPSRYIAREDFRAHEILINIQSGEPVEIWEKDSYGNPKNRILNPKRQVFPTHELYFKSPGQMQALFADLPEAVANTALIAEKCQFEFDFKAKHYPVFIPPCLKERLFTPQERLKAAESFLRELCEEGIVKRYTPERLAEVKKKYPQRDPLEVVRERLHYELSVILPKGMGDYLLIVWDFIYWAKQQGIAMGPGRGSGAGSIILYLIEITDIEPLRFNLFFERFINPERISYPDIDVDICMDRRADVIDYTVGKYGKDRVAQIITFGTMKAKMAMKDVGRMLSIPLSRVNQISKLIPEDPNMTLSEALKIDPELKSLYHEDAEVKRWIDLAQQLEGSVRSTGIHAAGMIISGEPILEWCPICVAKDSSMAVTQYSMKPVESIGMLKIDFLGLKTLTSIQHAVQAIHKTRGVLLDWVNLPLEDKPTFDLLNQGKTMGVFQLESGGMQDLAKQLHIDRFEEIIAVVALYRPGPMEMIPSFINRKHGREQIDIDHPWMQEILAETYGIMVYQEQVMAIASKLAGYTLGEGDVLRRAMGKKDREEMAGQRQKFRLGALQKGIDEATSMLIFDKVEKFASYGFNKSHAAAYGYLGYVTAYLKANYTREWLAALMTSDRDDLTKVAKHMHEAKAFQIAILPPDVNESAHEFISALKGIRFAMGGIKGIGEGVVATILKEREARGAFTSLYDFMNRLDTHKVGKKVVESLIESGCFDFTGWSRPSLLLSVDPIFEEVQRKQKDGAKGILSLFSLIEEENGERFASPPASTPVPQQQVLKREYELLGIYLNGHPLDEFRPQLGRLSCVPLSEVASLPTNAVFRAAFIIEGIVVKISAKSQRKFAILTIGDGIEHMELPIWPDLYESKSALIVENQLIYAVLQKEMQEGQMRLQCRWLSDLNQISEPLIRECDTAYDAALTQVKKKMDKPFKTPPKPSSTKTYQIHLDADQARLLDILTLKEAFRAHKGSTPVELLFLTNKGGNHSLWIDQEWGIEPHHELTARLRSLPCVKQVIES